MDKNEKRLILITNAVVELIISISYIIIFLQENMYINGIEVPKTLIIELYGISILINLIVFIILRKEISRLRRNILISLNLLNIIMGFAGLMSLISLLSIIVLLLKTDNKDTKVDMKKYFKYAFIGVIIGIPISLLLWKISTNPFPIAHFLEGIGMGISLGLMVGVLLKSRK